MNEAALPGIDETLSTLAGKIKNEYHIEPLVHLTCINHSREALFDAGMAYAVNQIVELLSGDVDGIHIFTMNNPVVAGRICDGIKNLI